MAVNYTVATQTDLANAITAINAAGAGSYTIAFSTNITLSGDLPAFTYGPDAQVSIDGGSFALDGAGAWAGLSDNGDTLTITNLLLRNMAAQPSANGTGGGLTVGGVAAVTLNNVSFYNDQVVTGGAGKAADDIFVAAGGGLTVNAGSLTNGGAASLGVYIQGQNTITFAPAGGQVVTVGDAIGDDSQGGSVNIAGAGTVSFTAADTYTGATTVNNGVLALNGAGKIRQSSGVALASANSTLDISGANGDRGINDLSGLSGSTVLLGANTLTENNDDAITFAGTISGSGGFTKAASGALTLSSATAYNGATTIKAGSLALFGACDLSSSSGVNVASGTFDIRKITADTEGLGGLSGNSGTFVRLGTKTLAINGYTFTTFGGVLEGAGGALTLNGGGTITLTGVNTYTGQTTLNRGTIALSGAGSIAASSSVDLVSGGTGFDISAATSPVTVTNLSGADGSTITLGANTLTEVSKASTGVGSNLTGTGGLSVSGAGTLGLSAYNNYTGATTIGAGALAITGNGSVANSSGVNITSAGGKFDISGTTYSQQIQGLTGVAGSQLVMGSNSIVVQSGNFAGIISGSGQFQKSGDGALILTGANSYTGNTVINAGNLQLGDGGTSGSILGAVTDDGTLTLNRSDTLTLDGNIYGSGNLVQAGTGTTILSGDDRYSGATTITQGVLQIGAGGTTGDLYSNVTLGSAGTLVFNRSDALGYYETISGGGAVAQNGAGTLTLTATNTYTGGTTIGGGTLELTNAAAAGTGEISFTAGQNGTLQVDDGTLTNAIRNFTTGDTIDLRNVGQVSSATLNGATLALTSANGTVNLQLDPGTAYTGMAFSAANDGTGGTNITVTSAGTTPQTSTFQGAASGYTVYANSDGSLVVQDNTANRDGTQTIAANGQMTFANGAGISDPTGLVGDVARLYQAAFDRTPDLSGLQYWAGEATTANVPLSAIASGFAASPEFVSTYGGMDNTTFVQTLYQNVLGRTGDSSGVSFWVNALSNGATQSTVLQSFAESDEDKAGTTGIAGDPNRAEAYRLYQAALDRTPDTSGLNFWSDALANGATAAQIAQGFTATTEFQTSYTGLDNSGFVQKMYQNVLGRAGDSAGISFWTDAMNNGSTQAQVLQSFADSAENRINTAGATHDGWVFVASS